MVQTAIKPGSVATATVASATAKATVSAMAPARAPSAAPGAPATKPGEVAGPTAEQLAGKAQKEYEETKAEFEATHVEVKPGEYYSKEDIEALEDPEAGEAFTKGY